MVKKKRIEELHADAVESVEGDDVEISTRIKKKTGGRDRNPEEFWMQGFQEGYKKAWDTMMPTMLEGVEKAREKIEERAIEKTLDGLEGTIEKRIKEAGDAKLVDMNAVISKREEFRQKKQKAFSKEEKLKYDHYLTLMEWVVSTHGDKL